MLCVQQRLRGLCCQACCVDNLNPKVRAMANCCHYLSYNKLHLNEIGNFFFFFLYFYYLIFIFNDFPCVLSEPAIERAVGRLIYSVIGWVFEINYFPR